METGLKMVAAFDKVFSMLVSISLICPPAGVSIDGSTPYGSSSGSTFTLGVDRFSGLGRMVVDSSSAISVSRWSSRLRFFTLWTLPPPFSFSVLINVDLSSCFGAAFSGFTALMVDFLAFFGACDGARAEGVAGGVWEGVGRLAVAATPARRRPVAGYPSICALKREYRIRAA